MSHTSLITKILRVVSINARHASYKAVLICTETDRTGKRAAFSLGVPECSIIS